MRLYRFPESASTPKIWILSKESSLAYKSSRTMLEEKSSSIMSINIKKLHICLFAQARTWNKNLKFQLLRNSTSALKFLNSWESTSLKTSRHHSLESPKTNTKHSKPSPNVSLSLNYNWKTKMQYQNADQEIESTQWSQEFPKVRAIDSNTLIFLYWEL